MLNGILSTVIYSSLPEFSKGTPFIWLQFDLIFFGYKCFDDVASRYNMSFEQKRYSYNGYHVFSFLLKINLVFSVNIETKSAMWMYAHRCILGEAEIGSREEGMLLCSHI